MNKINILDCTLRDGGYINDFSFGQCQIKDIISKLASAHIDIIECGFLMSKAPDPDKSLYPSVSAIKEYIGEKQPNTMYVAMIAFGDISIEEIEPCDNTSIDGIRLTFHNNQIDEAIEFGTKLKKLGYAVFVQPVGTMSYDDATLLKLIDDVNKMNPFAFYIVDTLGTMYRKDLMRIFYLYDNNLNDSIFIGFHSHNNLQLSFSNAIELMRINTRRHIIIDSSVNGMGRAAGNLCTEICAEYINNNIAPRYGIIQLLEIVDEYLNEIFNKTPWGYSVPYFISAIHGCHPNYASYLLNKKTLSVKSINSILKKIDFNERFLFNKQYIEELYIDFQERNVDDVAAREKFAEILNGKKIIILAPGASLAKNKDNIMVAAKDNGFLISVNFIPDGFDIDALFISNVRRLEHIESIESFVSQNKLVVATSNITTTEKDGFLIMNYADYINSDYRITDNAGLMLLNILENIGVKQVYLAGFDGFCLNIEEKGYSFMNADTDRDIIAKNNSISQKLSALNNTMGIFFLTNSEYRRTDEV